MKALLITLSVAAGLYALVCLLLYFGQERMLFFPDKLPANFRFPFRSRFEERWVTAPDGVRLHGLLFRAAAPKGLVFYLHGNGGALDNWGYVADAYTRLGYDVFMLDYRGYGKSQGRISSEQQLLEDVRAAYRHVLAEYPENRTVVLGYSLGTGPAAWLAANYQPRLLILQAAYYSLERVARHHFPWVPGFLVRYPLRTYQLLPRIKAPIVLFHGDHDEVVPYTSATELKPLLKPHDQLITLANAGHNGITDNPKYLRVLAEVL
ncbi:alpha/beta fold hydrolase [Hymenobacter oligotrophus]|uniref:Alpha/beta fold hydrolase n=1 Tax=Hymenobacter oligotrophus TaxID=2319843 RepID=A0A3B7RPL1_9BACT|nr:alpha/beta fold hydrolase [Hymenobacter oligotrophus]AYA36137.1 alpha/beta fold hydrolase [Hymenobacter oligotrophus]